MLHHAKLPHERGNGVVFFKMDPPQDALAPLMKVLTGTVLFTLVAAAAFVSWRMWP